tara:strand:- start:183 stop:452 length:270 start_codon:yes stop_codon:yes gene_type:complete
MSKEENLLDNHRYFLDQIKTMIESFGIECSVLSSPKRKKDQNTWDIYFSIQRNKKNIINFARIIGFRYNLNKIKELEKCVEILNSSLKA